MRHYSEFDAFERSLQQKIEEFGELPSDKVWEGLEQRWDKHNTGFVGGNLIWLWVGLISLTGTALWGWHAVKSMETLGQSPLSAAYIQEEIEILEPEIHKITTLVLPTAEQVRQETFMISSKLDRLPEISLLPTKLSDQGQFVPPHQEGIAFEAPIVETRAERVSESKANLVESKKQKIRKKLSLRNWWSSPRMWRNGKSWDYQIGLSAETANYHGRSAIFPTWNQNSSQYTGTLLFEFVPNHRLRFNVGLGWESYQYDYGLAAPTMYRDYINELANRNRWTFDFHDVVKFASVERAENIIIPINVLLFLRKPEKETQIWTGLELAQRYSVISGIEYTVGTMNDITYTTIQSWPNQVNAQNIRVMLGVEQRLSKALRLRAHGHYTWSNQSWVNRYGAGISLYWASPRGHLRWRRPRNKRALHL